MVKDVADLQSFRVGLVVFLEEQQFWETRNLLNIYLVLIDVDEPKCDVFLPKQRCNLFVFLVEALTSLQVYLALRAPNFDCCDQQKIVIWRTLDGLFQVFGHKFLNQLLWSFPCESIFVGNFIREVERFDFSLENSVLEVCEGLDCKICMFWELPLLVYSICLVSLPANSDVLFKSMWIKAGSFGISKVKW